MKLIALLLIVASSICFGGTPEQWESEFPMLSGKYEVIGRRFESDVLFAGTITINEVAPNNFTVTRVINGKTILGTGKVDYVTPDKIRLIRIYFKEKGKEMEGAFLYRADLDNNGRISGYVYPKGYEGEKPGIEALFVKREELYNTHQDKPHKASP